MGALRETRGRGVCFQVRCREIREILGVPDKFSVLNIVALGQKGEKKFPRTEKDLAWQNVHFERYGKTAVTE